MTAIKYQIHLTFSIFLRCLVLLGICATVHAQGISFASGLSPALQATATQGIVSPGRPSQILDGQGRTFTISYDANGRLFAIKKTSGRNIADMAVGYDDQGRIQGVRFDNGYEVVFHYGSDGTQEIRDSLGGRLLRSGNPWTILSTSDRSGHLGETLRRLETLFSFVQPVSGLNAVKTSSTAQ